MDRRVFTSLMATDPPMLQTSFQFENAEIRRYPFPVPVSVGTRVMLDGEDRDKDLRVIDVALDMNDMPVLVVEIGEQRGPGLTPA
ncbi:MAG: hypothetical protein ACM3QU_12225 [Verrucomicrobiota bacterium]